MTATSATLSWRRKRSSSSAGATWKPLTFTGAPLGLLNDGFGALFREWYYLVLRRKFIWFQCSAKITNFYWFFKKWLGLRTLLRKSTKLNHRTHANGNPDLYELFETVNDVKTVLVVVITNVTRIKPAVFGGIQKLHGQNLDFSDT